ncbi:hypothetical protein [Candidatus Palauibacter sp.]|uniref:hypothetical protein n=1 Tax=Candidatus Palauibacter sp. TaxID=3101350 RepID=UPI003CC59E7A
MSKVVLVEGTDAKLEVSNDGGTIFHDVPFAGSITYSGSEAPTFEVAPFEGVGQGVGKPRIGSIEVGVLSYVPELGVYGILEDAFDDGSILTFRITTKEEQLDPEVTGDTIAIATSGLVTFAGTRDPNFTGDEYGRGLVLETQAGAKYRVDAVSAAGAVTVAPKPSAAVAATRYSILNPSRRVGPFRGKVSALRNFELPAGGAMSSGLTIIPRARLPRWVVV